MMTKILSSKTSRIVVTAMMMCLIMVAIFILRIPIPFTQGYVNLSDAVIFLSVIMLGWKYGMAAASLGSMMGDIIGGFAMWAPWTFFIKGMMALIMGLMLEMAEKREDISAKRKKAVEVTAMAVSGTFMTGGYFIAEGIMYGNWIVAALGIPWNIGQFVVGMVLALVLEAALKKTSLRKFFSSTKEHDNSI